MTSRDMVGAASQLRKQTDDDESRWSDLAPREEARDLARAARDHFASVGPASLLRGRLDGATVVDHWGQWAEAGYPDIGLPAEVDGLGDALDLVVMIEEAGRALVGDGLLAACTATQLQLAAGFPVESLRTGRGTSGAGVGRLVDDRVTSGPIELLDASNATTLTVLLRDGASAHVVVVGTDAPGVRLTAHGRDHDPSRPLATLQLDQAPMVSSRTVDAARGESALAISRLAVAADLTGLADASLRHGIDHVVRRRQFGQPLGSFQALKHRIADAYVEVEKARGLVQGAALRVAEGRLDRRTHQLALMAAAVSSEAATGGAALLVQLLGAMGVTFEADAHLYFRRAHQTVLALDAPRVAFRDAARLEGHVDD